MAQLPDDPAGLHPDIRFLTGIPPHRCYLNRRNDRRISFILVVASSGRGWRSDAPSRWRSHREQRVVLAQGRARGVERCALCEADGSASSYGVVQLYDLGLRTMRSVAPPVSENFVRL